MRPVFSLRPTTYRLRSRLLSYPARGSRCVERVEIAPASKVRTAAAISLPGEFDRVIEVIDSSEMDTERRRIGSAEVDNHATIAYRYEDALIADGCWYAAQEYDILQLQARRRPVVAGTAQHFDEVQLCTDITSERFFGHWFCDGLSMEILAADRGLKAVALQGTKRFHEEGYRRLVSLQCEKLGVATVKSLWTVDDRAYNGYRVQRLHRLRAKLRSSVKGQGNRLVFVDRGDTGAARTLVNRNMLLDRLTQEGFVVIQPESMQSEDIAAALVDARLIVGVEGSQLKHSMLTLPEGSGVMAIQPPDRFNAWNKHVAQCMGLNFGFVVGDACEGGFSADIERTLRTIDLMLNAAPVRLDG